MQHRPFFLTAVRSRFTLDKRDGYANDKKSHNKATHSRCKRGAASPWQSVESCVARRFDDGYPRFHQLANKRSKPRKTLTFIAGMFTRCIVTQ